MRGDDVQPLNVHLLPANPDHFPDILALNRESVEFLSPLTHDRLDLLHTMAAYHKVVVEGPEVAAFLLALGPGTTYNSPNYQWFSERYDDFLYIDRVVVRPQSRSRKYGRLLYQDVFAVAASFGARRVVCEFDIDPPNPASAAFHRSMGFTEVGSQRIANGQKRVSLQSRLITCAS